LLASVPRLDAPSGQRLASIDGQPPRPGEIASGCAFAPRCPVASEVCREIAPPLRSVGPGREAACHAPFAAESGA
jgi:oligopeptide/dipeptide ABC transporter ATP-binding protein